MKIQCNVCESAEARVLCCADEAALCWSCDDKVHAANKLASKHQRVPLSTSSSPMPKCDICQETVGYFFCLEDRALLCRKCDISIHTANAYVSAHQRFLLTGVKVGLEPINPAASASSGKSHSVQKVEEQESPPISKRTAPVSSNAVCNDVLPVQTSGVEDFAPSSLPLVGGSTAGIIPQWQFDEFLGMGDFNQNYGYMDYGSSKADNGKVGESDSSPILRDAEVEGDECFSEVPEACWAVPQIPSPPTASGLYWPAKTLQNPFDSAVFESDGSCSSLQNFQHQQSNGFVFKRRRAF
ncbi:B-box zinc finger protein 22-like [Nicotiana sylvestris]|uniref:Probable salt tolerance-like protein At1g78600 n=1 Tax=Nicotiana sylvestris TaxID=4096 RepID=A0A1U7VXD4_NICSY|nr:PREDICTED: probable salt tolerance-like protein At1g78600 [Nicotiana sylvestris]